ncbi:CPBP family intramembrane glutamic endopeptidase [Actinobacillus vicugnae]|uniref:CPBP family intramembrane glutamic endopeptidase n=1 Tax=Actinobacillus vicugnae TaxID=2573093 RepID=UPI00124087FB|nr:CPBP family intramembrane glutamic endopeptidase [Actinobacillus vicugnae]
MKKSKITTLEFIDIIILSIIFFGAPIYYSLAMFFETQYKGVSFDKLIFNDLANYNALIQILLSLFVAWIYLTFRKFDFNVLNFKINRRTLPTIFLLVCSAGLVADIYQYIHYIIFPEHYANIYSGESYSPKYNLILLITCLANGFYEEIFFMGLVFATKPKYMPYAIGYSILVRFIFHTYQGWAGALTIVTLGIVFLFFRKKISSLVPFFIAHAIFDIFGLGLLGIIYSVGLNIS